ncbi:hypothetical protein ACQ4LK_22415, partial [Bacillus pumilus]
MVFLISSCSTSVAVFAMATAFARSSSCTEILMTSDSLSLIPHLRAHETLYMISYALLCFKKCGGG